MTAYLADLGLPAFGIDLSPGMMLGRAGLPVRAGLVREPDDDGGFAEVTPQAFLLARKPYSAPAG
jgi:hypothetical protein